MFFNNGVYDQINGAAGNCEKTILCVTFSHKGKPPPPCTNIAAFYIVQKGEGGRDQIHTYKQVANLSRPFEQF